MPLMTRKILFQQGINGVPVNHPAEDVRLSSGSQWTPAAGDPLRVRSGVVAGSGSTSATPCEVTAQTSQVTVGTGRFVIQGSTALQGHYEGTVDAANVRTLSSATVGAGLPGSGEFKAGRVLIRVYDQLYGDTQDGWDIEVHMGAAATTVGGAALPALPTNSLQLKTFTVDSAGVITLGAAAVVLTVPRGAVLPVSSTDVAAGAHIGQYRDHPTRGLERWDGAWWINLYLASDTGDLAAAGFGTGFVQGAELVRIRVRNGWVFLNAHIETDSGSRIGHAFTLPAGVRPLRRHWFFWIAGNGIVGEGQIRTDGTVHLINRLNNTSIGMVISIAFPVA